jgi:hypothetical protein
MQRTDILKLAALATDLAISFPSEAKEKDSSINELLRLADEAQKHFSEYFPITSVSRGDFDLHGDGYDGSTLTDDQMESLASSLSDHFTEYGGYWEVLENFAEESGLEKVGEEDEDD